jgi:outer membrane translocation and assembly module TamA
VLPRSERSSQLFVSYTIFTPRYRAFHNIETFELAEDQQLGPTATITGGVAFHLIGSENNFVRVSTSAGWTEPFADDGLWHVEGSSEHRYDEGGWIDNYVSFGGRIVTPSFGIGRVVFDADVSSRWDETQNRFLTAGGDSGLRGFIIGEFTGQRRFVGHVELRTASTKVWFTRAGAVAFTDVGSAANSFGAMDLHDDVGVGLRVVVPQTSPEPIRIDWAFAVDGDHRGWPGRIIAGYRQGF